MPIKASEVGKWLRKTAATADHRRAVPDDPPLVVAPGPAFNTLMQVIADLAEPSSRKGKQDASSSPFAAERQIES